MSWFHLRGLIFFTVASMWLCFGFVLETVLIIQSLFCYMVLLLLSSAYTEPRPFPLLAPPCQRDGWECTRSWEGTQTGQVTQTDQRDIPYHMMSCSVYKELGGRGGGAAAFGVMVFVFPSNHYVWQSPAFLGMAEHLPAHGKWGMNSFALLSLCVQLLLYLLNCLYVNQRVFSL